MHRLGFAVGALLAGVACSSEQTLVWAPLPPADEAKALVIGVHRSSGFEVHAVDLAPHAPTFEIPIDAGGGEEVRLEALAYRVPLARLGLVEGPVGAAEGASARPLPPAWDVHETVVRGGVVTTGWAESEQPSGALSGFRIKDGVSPCLAVTSRTFEVNSESPGVLAVPLGDGRVLASTSDGDRKAYVVTASGTHALSPPTRLLSGFRSGDGSVWLGGERGQMWRATVTDQVSLIRAVGSSTPAEDLRWLDGRYDGVELEAFALTGYGTVHRFSRGQWTSVHQFASLPGDDLRAGVAWVGPGEALAVWRYDRRLVRWRNGDTRLIESPDPHGLVAVADVPGIGVVVGTRSGDAIIRRNDRWWPVGPQHGRSEGTAAIAAFEGGFVYTPDAGRLGQYHAGWGVCPEAEVSDHVTWDIAKLGPMDFVLVGDRHPGLTPVTVVHLGP